MATLCRDLYCYKLLFRRPFTLFWDLVCLSSVFISFIEFLRHFFPIDLLKFESTSFNFLMLSAYIRKGAKTLLLGLLPSSK